MLILQTRVSRVQIRSSSSATHWTTSQWQKNASSTAYLLNHMVPEAWLKIRTWFMPRSSACQAKNPVSQRILHEQRYSVEFQTAYCDIEDIENEYPSFVQQNSWIVQVGAYLMANRPTQSKVAAIRDCDRSSFWCVLAQFQRSSDINPTHCY